MIEINEYQAQILDRFHRLTEQGEGLLNHLKSEYFFETNVLDFKNKSSYSDGNVSEEDRKQLAKAISGFSNSGGGIIVWGIDCRKDKDGTDKVDGGTEIPQLTKFCATMQRLSGEVTRPQNELVETRAVYTNKYLDMGYAITVIPRSERRPLRSEVRGIKNYYKRAGESFFEMDHYDIEDAFSRNTRPSLYLDSYVSGHDIQPGMGEMTVDIHVRIMNNSAVAAKIPYVKIMRKPAPDLFKPKTQDRGFFNQRREVNYDIFYSNNDVVLHVGDHLDVCHYSFKMYYNQSSGEFYNFKSTRNNEDMPADLQDFDLSINAIFGCDGMMPKTSFGRINWDNTEIKLAHYLYEHKKYNNPTLYIPESLQEKIRSFEDGGTIHMRNPFAHYTVE